MDVANRITGANLNDHSYGSVVSNTIAHSIKTVQKSNVLIPVKIFYTLDFSKQFISSGGGIASFKYQTHKFLFQTVTVPSQPHSNKLIVKSVIAVFDWKLEKFKQDGDTSCKQHVRYMHNHSCAKIVERSYRCDNPTQICLFHYESFTNIFDGIVAQNNNFKNKVSRKFSWTVLGTSANNIDGNQIERFTQPTGYDLYLNDWKTRYSVDVVLLSLLYHNITTYIGENIRSDRLNIAHPYARPSSLKRSFNLSTVFNL